MKLTVFRTKTNLIYKLTLTGNQFRIYNNKAGTVHFSMTVPALLLMLTDSRCIIVRRAWGWRGSLDKRAVCHRQVR